MRVQVRRLAGRAGTRATCAPRARRQVRRCGSRPAFKVKQLHTHLHGCSHDAGVGLGVGRSRGAGAQPVAHTLLIQLLTLCSASSNVTATEQSAASCPPQSQIRRFQNLSKRVNLPYQNLYNINLHKINLHKINLYETNLYETNHMCRTFVLNAQIFFHKYNGENAEHAQCSTHIRERACAMLDAFVFAPQSWPFYGGNV